MNRPGRIALGALVVLAGIGSACTRTVYFDVGDAAPDAEPDAPPTTRPPPCTDDSGCGLDGLRCLTDTGDCVECLGDDDCTRDGLPHCDATSHRCVECGTSGASACTVEQACKLGVCVTPCENSFECDVGECEGVPPLCELCESAGACGGDTPICDRHLQRCVECEANGDCGGALLHCEPLNGACVECLTSTDCPPATPWCDPSTYACVSA